MKMDILIGLSSGVAFFIVCYMGFRAGLRLGMTAVKGIVPEPIKNPVKAFINIKQDIAQTKDAQAEAEDLAKMFSYNGDIPKKEG